MIAAVSSVATASRCWVRSRINLIVGVTFLLLMESSFAFTLAITLTYAALVLDKSQSRASVPKGRMMLCPKDHSNKPETSSFCFPCGFAIADCYNNCRFDNIPEARVCGGCVAPDRIFRIDSSKTDSSRREEQLGARGNRDDERRHLMSLFSALVGSITFVAQVDSEESRKPITPGDLKDVKALLDELSISGGGEH
jgi:hypothetical protein